MKKYATLALGLLFVGAAMADEPTIIGEAATGGAPSHYRDTCWDQPYDPDGTVISCEVMAAYDLVSELASDFIFGEDHELTGITWSSGSWNSPGPPPPGFNIMFYEDNGYCAPVPDPFVALTDVQPTLEEWGAFRWECTFCFADPIPVLANTRYWAVCQIADHEFPPQFGHVVALQIMECESMFRCVYFGYPDWIPASLLTGYPVDGSLTLYCDQPSGADLDTWGTIKNLYR